MHDRRQMFRLVGPDISSDLTYVEPGSSKTVMYRVKMVRLSPDGDVGCDRQEDEDGQEEEVSPVLCKNRHMEREMGCRMPWVEEEEDGEEQREQLCPVGDKAGHHNFFFPA